MNSLFGVVSLIIDKNSYVFNAIGCIDINFVVIFFFDVQLTSHFGKRHVYSCRISECESIGIRRIAIDCEIADTQNVENLERGQ